MKYLIILALFFTAFTAYAGTIDQDWLDNNLKGGKFCGKERSIGEQIPDCGGGGLILTTSWKVCELHGNIAKGDYTQENCQVVRSYAEYYRKSWLETARQILSKPMHNWKGTIVQNWLDRYLGGER